MLARNLDTIGHSQVCHSIQDRTLENQLFELIINPASLRPIAEDRLETEELSLRPNSGDDSCSPASTLYGRLFGCAVLLILIVVTATRSVALHHGKWFVSQ